MYNLKNWFKIFFSDLPVHNEEVKNNVKWKWSLHTQHTHTHKHKHAYAQTHTHKHAHTHTHLFLSHNLSKHFPLKSLQVKKKKRRGNRSKMTKNYVLPGANDCWCQFHQHYIRKFFVRMSFRQLFLHMYVRKKAAEKTFVHKICVFNVDEIEPW